MRNFTRIAKFPKSTRVAAVLAASLTAAALARASRAEGEKLKVETTLHVLASIAREIGGDDVEAEALARSVEDPHEVTATPQRMVKMRDADAFIESGFQLEIWDENLLDGARNPKIRKNTDGFCFAGDGRRCSRCPRCSRARAATSTRSGTLTSGSSRSSAISTRRT